MAACSRDARGQESIAAMELVVPLEDRATADAHSHARLSLHVAPTSAIGMPRCRRHPRSSPLRELEWLV